MAHSASGASKQRVRSRLFTRPADQFRTSLVPTLGAALLLVILVTVVHEFAAARTAALAADHPEWRPILQAQARSIEQTLAFGSVFYLLGLLVVGLVHSRRLMGALFAMDRRIRRLADGDFVSPMRLRRGDYFHDVAEEIDRAASSLHRQAQEDLADVDDLISILDRSPQAGPFRDGLRETLVSMRERKRRLLSFGERPEAPSASAARAASSAATAPAPGSTR